MNPATAKSRAAAKRYSPFAVIILAAAIIALALTAPWAVQAQTEPTTPSNLTATIVEDGVALAWTAPTQDTATVDGYQILSRRPDNGENTLSTLVADTNSVATTYTDSTATEPNTVYLYRIKALRGDEASPQSDSVSIERPDPTDLRPTNLDVSLVQNRVTLSWSAPAKETSTITGYLVQRRRPLEGETTLATLVADTGNTQTSYIDATANEPGVRYVYRVKALRGSWVSLRSNFDRITLPQNYQPPPPDEPASTPTPAPAPTPAPENLAPTNLAAVLSTDSGVVLTWTSPAEQVDSITGYEILRAIGDGDSNTLVDDSGGTSTNYTDSTATQKGGSYTYQVKAIRGEDRSQASPQTQIQIPHDSVDLAPTGLTATVTDGGGVSLSWIAPTEQTDSIDGYEVLRAAGEAEMTTLVADTGSTSTAYTDATATQKGETYTYQVKANRGAEQSQVSPQAQIHIPHDPINLAPSNLTATLVSGTGVDLSWYPPDQDADSVNGYHIIRASRDGVFSTLVANSQSTNTTYRDTTATKSGEAYSYQVQAIRGTEQSQASNQAQVQVPIVSVGIVPAFLVFTPDEETTNVPTLVKNTAQNTASTALSVSSGDPRAQSFVTSSFNPSGYTLHSVGVSLNSITSTATTDLAVTIHQASGSDPDTAVDCTLTRSGAYIANSVNTFDAPAGCDLTASTAYFVIITLNAGTFSLDNTASANEDTGSNTNWSIGDDSLEYDAANTTWDTVTNSLQIDVKGTIKDSVLLSNTGQTGTSNNSVDATTPYYAQLFDTGDNDHGYRLNSIGVSVATITSASGLELTATLHESSGNAPGDVVCTLDEPSGYANNIVNEFTAPLSCPHLPPQTEYFFVLKRETTSTITASLQWIYTTTTNADSGFADGWAYTGTLQSKTATGTTWTTAASNVLKIAIKGTIHENPPADITVFPFAELTVTEDDATAQTYTVVLDREPTANVTVTVGGHAGTDVTVSPSTLTFTPTNWHTAQTISVTAKADDDAVTDDKVTLTHIASGTPQYTNIRGHDVDVTITEVDTASATVAPTALMVEEGTPKPFTVVLDTEPSKNVIVDITVDGDGVSVSPTSLTFSPTNWETAQEVAVTVADDDDAVDDPAVTINNTIASGSAAEYATVTLSSVAVTPIDDEEAGVTITPTSFALLEGGSDTYTVVLTSEPTASVTITIAGHAGTDASLSGLTLSSSNVLTFTDSNWNTAQTVSVAIAHDADIVDDAEVTLTHTVSSTGDYSAVTAEDISVTNTDDDSEVTIAPTSASAEESQAARFTLTRSGYTGSSLTVNVAVSETGGWEYIQGTAPTTVQFAANASTTTLNVNTDDDLVVGNSGSITAELSASSTLPADGKGYVTGSPDSATVNITDNDNAADVGWGLELDPTTIKEGFYTTVTLEITSGHTFAMDQTLRLRWNNNFVALHTSSRSSPRLILSELTGITGIVTGLDGMTLAAGDTSVAARLGVYVDGVRTLYITGTVGEAAAPLHARLDTTDVAIASLTIQDEEDTPEISVTVPQTVQEGDNIVVSASISPRTNYPVQVPLAHNDPNGALTGIISDAVRFNSKDSSTRTNLATLEDVIDTDAPDHKTVTITLSNPVASTIMGSGIPANLTGSTTFTVRVLDDDHRPSQPVDLTATAGDTVVDLAWTAGNPGTSSVTGYEYRHRAAGSETWDPDWAAIPSSSSSTVSYRVTGLRNDTGYLFEVRAVSAAGKGYSARGGVGSFSILVDDPDQAPKDFRHHVTWNLDEDNRPTGILSQHLRWATPRLWRNYNANRRPVLTEYEIHQRQSHSSGEWTDWTPTPGTDGGYLPINDNRLSDLGTVLRNNEITAASVSGVERPPLCWHKQWRIRAIYFDPPEHSTWDYADADRSVDAHVPLTPDLERLDQSLIKTGDNSYRLTFAWGNSAYPCWPSTSQEVQSRQFVGMWFGSNPPRDGDTLTNGTAFDTNNMTAVYNRVWTNWTTAANLSASARQHTFDFTGEKSYQLRVRAQNAHGSGPWTSPWLFTINLRFLSDYSTRVQ